MKKSEVKISKKDLADLIRDEIYGANVREGVFLEDFVVIPIAQVKKIAKKIAMRTIIGH